MKDKHRLILRLKGLSRDMRAAGRLMEKIYGKGSTDPDLREAAKMLNSWTIEISGEIKRSVSK